jgi:signal transduction histidine kinase
VTALGGTASEAGSPAGVSQQDPKGTRRALVVEDDEDLREVLRRALLLDRFECRTVASGREALVFLSASGRDRPGDGEFDLVLIDILMPEMDGLELTRRIRAEDERSAIVVATAVDGFARVREALRLGADEYLVNPFSSQQLRLAYEQALERRILHRELRRAEQARRELVDLIFHDLRNPLSVARGYLSLMQACPAATTTRDIASATAACDALVNMIDEVADLGRLEGDDIPVQRRTLSLQNVVLDVADRWRTLSERTGKRIHVRCASNLPPVVADEQLLRRIISSLLAGAVKHASGKTSIVVEFFKELESSYVKLEITDDGPAVPVEMRALLFDRLRQGELRSVGIRRGQGVALPFAEEACRCMGGRIWVDDAEPLCADWAKRKAGCRFVVALPVASMPGDNRPRDATLHRQVQTGRSVAL